VKPEVVRLVTEEELAKVRELRKQMEGFDHQIELRDYEDPGDRQEKGEA